jgi:hypothetical protein
MGNLDRFREITWSEAKAKEMPRHQNLLAVIVASEIVPVGNAGEQDLQVLYEVLDGPSKGSRIVQHIPVFSRDSERYLRGRVFFRALCRGLGVSAPSDSAELHGKPVIISVARHPGAEDRPVVFHYAPCSESNCKAWKKWAAQEATRFNAKTQPTQDEAAGDQ